MGPIQGCLVPDLPSPLDKRPHRTLRGAGGAKMTAIEAVKGTFG